MHFATTSRCERRTPHLRGRAVRAVPTPASSALRSGTNSHRGRSSRCVVPTSVRRLASAAGAVASTACRVHDVVRVPLRAVHASSVDSRRGAATQRVLCRRSGLNVSWVDARPVRTARPASAASVPVVALVVELRTGRDRADEQHEHRSMSGHLRRGATAEPHEAVAVLERPQPRPTFVGLTLYKERPDSLLPRHGAAGHVVMLRA